MSRAVEWTQAQAGIHSSIQIFIYTDTRCDTSGGNAAFQGSEREVRERERLSHTCTPPHGSTHQLTHVTNGRLSGTKRNSFVNFVTNYQQLSKQQLLKRAS